MITKGFSHTHECNEREEGRDEMKEEKRVLLKELPSNASRVHRQLKPLRDRKRQSVSAKVALQRPIWFDPQRFITQWATSSISSVPVCCSFTPVKVLIPHCKHTPLQGKYVFSKMIHWAIEYSMSYNYIWSFRINTSDSISVQVAFHVF